MRLPRSLILSLAAATLVVAGCGTAPPPVPARPEEVRARIAGLLPQSVADRPGWAIDIYAAFDALHIEPSPSLTTLHLPTDEVWARAGEYLVNWLAGRRSVLHHEVDASLVVRESTCPPPLP